MSNTINADDGIISGTAGLKYSADTSGALVLQTNGTTAITISASQAVTFTGSVTFASASFTNLSYTGTFTGGTGVVNLGSNQFYKDASGNIGIGVVPTSYAAVGTATPTRLSFSTFYSSAEICTYQTLSIYLANVSATESYGFGVGTNGVITYRAGAAATGIHAFVTSNTERMRITAAGYVGIATSSPRFNLSIGEATSTPTATPNTLDLGGTYSSTAGANGKLRVWYDTSAYMGFGVSASQLDYIATGAYAHVWYSNGSERMRLDTSGNFVIGGSSTVNKFEVFGNDVRNTARASTTAGNVLIEAQASDYWSAPTYTGTSLRQYGSTASGTLVGLSNAGLGVLGFQNVSAGLIFTNGASPIVIGTTAVERMRITASGGLSFGSSGTAYGTAGQVLYSNGNASPSWGAPTSSYSVDSVVIAGGGGGGAGATGSSGGGGGGAGGVLQSTSTLISGVAYAVTIGPGGAGGIATNGATSLGVNGTNSSIIGGSISLIAYGGGGGAGTGSTPTFANGSDGGSGGGGGGGGNGNQYGGGGVIGQGFQGSGANTTSPNYGSGGGGGAGGPGSTPGNTNGGNGGLAISLPTWANATSSGLYGSYAGGGGGGTYSGGSPGAGGVGTTNNAFTNFNGGAGVGNTNTGAGGTAIANTGSGGGGNGGSTGTAANGGAGGSGIVMIRYAGAQRGTGGTVTSYGGYTYHKFTTSGTYTA